MQSLIVLAFLVSELAGKVKISGRPSLEKLYFWDPRSKRYQLCEFCLIWKTWKFYHFLARFLRSSKHTTD